MAVMQQESFMGAEDLQAMVRREAMLWMPDIIEFALSPDFLNQSLYPRQATMLKIAFLQDELFTEYDHQVIGEWIRSFEETGYNGCQPDIYERIRICKEEGRPWFREWINAIGRRGSKGFVGAIGGAYVLWNYLCKRNPQAVFGIARDKRLDVMVFAGKKEQARDNQWKDLTDVIKGAPCFSEFISRSLNESLSVWAPNDWPRLAERRARGIVEDGDMASFLIRPLPAVPMAARGQAVFCQLYDEFAHVVRQVAKADACLDPKSLVLGSDLIWRPIGDLKVGDRLVGLDEEVVGGTQRRLQESIVVATTRNVQRPYRLNFNDGTSVVCSGNHRWLLHHRARWAEARYLRPGSVIRAFAEPWETDETRLWEGRVPQGRFKLVVSIDRLPEQELVDLETTTHTYIAEGLVSHNSEVYEAATPALDTFGEWAWLYEPSSPWAKTGQFYENWLQSLAVSDGTDGLKPGEIVRPEMLMFQLTSWDPYIDWEKSHTIPCMPVEVYDHRTEENVTRGKRKHSYYLPRQVKAQQSYDRQMKRIQASNPETFAVERLSHWASVMDAYLNEDKVKNIFAPWPENNPMNLTMKTEGPMSILYKAHGDPSKSGANFGFAVAHVVRVKGQEFPHVLFDFIKHWAPQDFPDNDYQIDYDLVFEELKTYVDAFVPTDFTLDQFSSNWLLSRLAKWARRRNYPRQVQIWERTANLAQNWQVAETFKTAIGQNLVHAPYYEQAQNELLFLQKVTENRVDHPTSGPVQTKDVADCLMILVEALIGDEIAAFVNNDLSGLSIRGSAQGGFPSVAEQAAEQSGGDPAAALHGWSRNRPNAGAGFSPARGRFADRGKGNLFGRTR